MAEPIRIAIENDKKTVDPRHNSHGSAKQALKDTDASAVALFVVKDGAVSVSVVGNDESGDMRDAFALINALQETASEMIEKMRDGLKEHGVELDDIKKDLGL